MTIFSASRVRTYSWRFAAASLLWIAAAGFASASATTPAARTWDRASAVALLAYIERIDSHGLNPAHYRPDALRQALAVNNAAQLERQASESFGFLALDLANGHVPPAQRRRFHIATKQLEPAEAALLIERALDGGNVAETLDKLAPRHPQYARLRSALARLPTGSTEQRRKIQVALERWRWMPRELGDGHLLVNIPEYRVRLMTGGREVASHRVIVGRPRTPTPQFSTQVSAVILNPSWYVPQSIVAESVGALVRNNPTTARARGYTWSSSGGQLRVIQQPGPQNALGQMRLDMPNGFSVFLHDTPNKALFDEAERTFSHGCVRTDKPFDLAERLLVGTGWNRTRIDETVAGRRTQRIPLSRPLPIYIVYLPAYAAADGTISYFGDPYSLDDAVGRRLNDGTRTPAG